MLRDMCRISFEEAVKAVTPFLVALVAALAIITYVPEIVLVVPRSLGLLR
jgi:TRAP-type C4-dicarboxylate transport system permease large subunit